MYFKIAGVILIVFAIAIVASVFYRNSSKAHQPIVFSDHDMLDGLWNAYKSNNLDTTNSRTFDRSRDDATTSEGESYTMLRAVLWNDKTTFDASWAWTEGNLQHTSGDSLFSWFYGKKADGVYGVDPTTGGNNTATDGDEDIALSLVFAHDRWGTEVYLDSATKIMNDIWTNEVVVINGKPYLLANNVELHSDKGYYIVDPSYLAPADYTIFAKYDPEHDWSGLSDNSYQVLLDSMSQNLDKTSTAELPPDWIAINSTTGAIIPVPNNAVLTTNYSYDAMRVPFRMAVEYQWFGDDRAKVVLQKMSFLQTAWNENGLLDVTYAHDGTVVTSQEAPAIYGGDLGYFEIIDPTTATKIYNNKLKVLYDPDTNSWKGDVGYYDDNWAWFGMALHDGAYDNLDAQP